MTLYIRHRPQSFDEFVGNEAVIISLKSILSRLQKHRPHVYLFEGDYGTGKTTLAQILAKELGCTKAGLEIIDAGTHRKVDTADKIKERLQYMPFSGKVKICIIDEIQTTSGSKFQESMLHTLENGCPEHVYFILCTTDSSKINKGIMDRSVIFNLRKYTIRELSTVIENVYRKEYPNRESDRVLFKKIAVKANGSPREALTILEKVIDFIGTRPVYEIVDKIELDSNTDGIDIAKALLSGKSWKYITDALKKTKNTPEEISRAIANYCSGILLNGYNKRAYQILATFMERDIDRNKLIYLLASLV